jgi:hypothetical protein
MVKMFADFQDPNISPNATCRQKVISTDYVKITQKAVYDNKYQKPQYEYEIAILPTGKKYYFYRGAHVNNTVLRTMLNEMTEVAKKEQSQKPEPEEAKVTDKEVSMTYEQLATIKNLYAALGVILRALGIITVEDDTKIAKKILGMTE